MGRAALWLAQATTSSTPGPPDGGPGAMMRGGPGGPGGPGGTGGKGDMMRDGAYRFAEHARDHGDNHHWWMFALVAIVAVVVIGLLIWAIIAFTKATKSATGAGTGTAPSGPSAKELLDQRLAKGDISPEDYEARKKLLDG